MENSFESVVNFLESYRGRDKVIRTLCYGSQLVGGIISKKTTNSSQLGKSLLLFSAQLSHCRTVLRLFDDLSMAAYSQSYGLGSTEEDRVLRCISVLINVADQLYYPCEHVAWAADAGLIKIKSDKWWTLSTVLWGVSLLLGTLSCQVCWEFVNKTMYHDVYECRIIVIWYFCHVASLNDSKFRRSLRTIRKLRKKAQKCREAGQEDSRESASAAATVAIQKQIWGEFLNILSSLADLSNAIHWMPPGFLWAGCFPDWLVGLMGTASSLLGMLHMSSSD